MQAIETAISQGEILRTHLLRPTWHLVSANDIYWMLAITAPQIMATVKSRHKDLELTDAILLQSNRILENALGGGEHLTREELMAELAKKNIATDNNRASHLLVWAELNGIVCSGTLKQGKQTYALLAERIPRPKPISKEEALARLAKKYFTSHAPATLQDFVWWSGLPAAEAKSGLESVKSEFIPQEINSQTYWFDKAFSNSGNDRESVHLLPAYDEFIISYKDRSASLPFEHFYKAVSNNGIFRPVVLHNGQVIGIWKRTAKKDRVIVEIEYFARADRPSKGLFENTVTQFGRFLEKGIDVLDIPS
jgi:hypothetical protein